MSSAALGAKPGGSADASQASAGPKKAGLVLATLIIVAAVANLPLAMANVALPSIGAYFDASQTQLNLVAVAYSLGLACSVLWLGALGDRYGRKMMAVLGVALAIPAALISGFSPTIQVLIFGRLFGGFAAGMAYPTTLALIAALWGPGPGRTRSIALWAAIGGAISVSGPLLSGLLLQFTTWPWVFWIVIPLAVVALFLAWKNIPAHINEATEPVDNLGGILSVVLVGTFVLSINFLPVAGYQKLAIGLLVIAVIAGVLFVIRQRRAKNPLYDLKVAARPTFWVAAVAGIIVFGALMGSMFIGQQYMQDVLGFGTVQAALPALFAGAFMILAAPRSAKIVEAARFPLHAAGRLCLCLPRFPDDAAALDRDCYVLGGGAGVYFCRHRHRPVRHAGFALADGVGPGDAGRDGVRHGRPAARPGRCALHFALRRPAGRRLCGCDDRRHRGRSGRLGDTTLRRQRPDHVLCGRAVGCSGVSAICDADHVRGQDLVPGRRSICLPRGHHRGAARGSAGVPYLPEAG